MKKRADERLVELGLARDLELARSLIMEGRVFLGQERLRLPSQAIEEGERPVVKEASRYVSRGGYKLERAMELYPIRLEGARCLDVGSSTGGFTDCMLQNGASEVYAIDVGYGLLDYRLRQDERVHVRERTNARRLTLDQLDGRAADFASMDVSFISVRMVLPTVCACLRDGAELVILVKPQFEAPRDKVGKGGIVRDPQVHREVLQEALAFLPQVNLTALGLTVSPIKGMDGNTEFLLYAGLRTEKPQGNVSIEETLALAWNGRLV